MEEFDFQWESLPSPAIEYNEERVKELLDLTKLPLAFFNGKLCLDVGCGNGRYTYAMLRLGARVDSFDISEKAVEKCRAVNPSAYVYDLMNLRPNPKYDFVLCWGVLHHLPNPREGFRKVASQVKRGGILHIMVYHKETQKVYEEGRRIWHKLSIEEKLSLCRKMIKRYGGNLHGWWDAFNPEYNWSYEPEEIKRWFKEEGFKEIRLIKKYNINMRGVKR
jgi:2-polyprenyl-3-methyl-5-hydroxy-6-metoxy-1,4-benzoquinol methylase